MRRLPAATELPDHSPRSPARASVRLFGLWRLERLRVDETTELVDVALKMVGHDVNRKRELADQLGHRVVENAPHGQVLPVELLELPDLGERVGPREVGHDPADLPGNARCG